MITKDDRVTMIWETNKFEKIRSLSNSTDDICVSLLFEQLYDASANLAQNFERLTDEQKSFFKESLASTLGTEEVIVQTDTIPDPEYISTNDVSKILGISPQAVRKWCETGKLDATRTFGKYGEWKIPTEQFERNKEMKEKFRNVINEKRIKQSRTHSALKEITKLPYYRDED